LKLLFVLILSIGCSDDDKKGVGEQCAGNEDCADEICHQGICWSANPKPNGASCNSRAVCKSGVCTKAICVHGSQAGGTSCLYNEMCASGKCQAGVCVSLGVDGGPDAGPVDSGPVPDRTLTDGNGPDVSQPDAIKVDAAKPDAAKVDAAKPDAAKPDAAKPDATQPDTAPWADALPWPDQTPPDLLPTGHCAPGMKRPCYTGAVGCTGTPSTGYTCVKDSICKAGVQTCAVLGPWPVADAKNCVGEVLPSVLELCNDKDDNCNGSVDEGYINISKKGQACTAGQGACLGTGVWACKNTMDGMECNAKANPTKKKPETCDGTDENCDGIKDNGRCFDDWTKLPVNSPAWLIGSTRGIAAEGKIVLLGGDKSGTPKILRSDDSGQTWKLVHSPTNGTILGVGLSGTTAVAIDKKAYLYYSADAGKTWKTGPRCGANLGYADVAIHKGTVLVTGGEGKVCRSLDGGKTIANTTSFKDGTKPVVMTSVTLNTVSSLKVGLAVGYRSSVSTTLVPVYRSLDGGKTWSLSNTGITSPPKARLFRVRLDTTGQAYITTMYANSIGSLIHITANTGTSWTTKTLSTVYSNDYKTLAIGPKGTVVACGTSLNTCYRSKDKGANFANKPTFPSGAYGNWTAMAFNGTDTLYIASTSYGEAYSTPW